ncbi:unnamed protein product [Effrenium voratum]|uniref:Uncharacterized protein n=1 Tax=Effrenium voratum TaxID=2562239 RepID=A0AA36IH67_9DINO|nr:unnamed protein product [Effrenium voratum]
MLYPSRQWPDAAFCTFSGARAPCSRLRFRNTDDNGKGDRPDKRKRRSKRAATQSTYGKLQPPRPPQRQAKHTAAIMSPSRGPGSGRIAKTLAFPPTASACRMQLPAATLC